MRKLIFALFILFTSCAYAQNSALEPRPIDTTYYTDGSFSVHYIPVIIILPIELHEVIENGHRILYDGEKPYTGSKEAIINHYHANFFGQPVDDNIVCIKDMFIMCYHSPCPPSKLFARFKNSKWIIDNSYL